LRIRCPSVLLLAIPIPALDSHSQHPDPISFAKSTNLPSFLLLVKAKEKEKVKEKVKVKERDFQLFEGQVK